MRRRITIAAIAATIMFGAAPMSVAHADGGASSTTVSAAVTNDIGFRNITSVLAGPLTSATTNSSATLGGTYTVVVGEVTRSAGTPWTLSADVTNFTGAVSAGTIPKTALSASARTLGGVGTNGTNTYTVDGVAPGSSGTASFGATAVDFGKDSQSAGLHSGTYTGTGTLTLAPPVGTAIDTYTATLTVTLVN
jgi:hypothetical protein